MKLLLRPAALGLLSLPFPAVADLVEETRLLVVQTSSITEVGLAAVSNGLVGDLTTRQFGGEFSAIFSFDRDSLAIESFRFNGGEILTSGYLLEFTGNITYDPPFGQRFTYVLRQPNSIPTTMRFSPRTREAADGLLRPDGTLRNIDHFLHADYGSQITARTVAGSNQPPVLVNYTLSPANLPFKGTATPHLEETASTVHQRTLQVYLTIEYDEAEITTLPGNVQALNLDVLETETGTVTAKSFAFTIPTGYGQWSEDNGLGEVDPEARNLAGIPYAILYALDLPADAASLPIAVGTGSSGPVVTLTLPEGGLRNAMTAEYSRKLGPTRWSPLPDAHHVDGTDSLDRGATGEPGFTFPAGPTGFIRFTTTLE